MAPASSAVKAVPLLANVRGRRLRAPEREQWSGMAESMKAGGAGLQAVWGTDDRDRDGCFRIHAAYLLPDEVVLVEHALPAGSESYPGLGPLFPVAGRLQRSVADLLGLDDRVRAVDLAVTGQAVFDWEALRGRVVVAVARAAQRAGRPTVVLARRVDVGRRELSAAGIDAAYAVEDGPTAHDGGDSAHTPEEDLATLAARVARTWSR